MELLIAALNDVDRAIVAGAPYDDVVELLDRAAQQPGAEQWAQGIAHRRFSMTLAYDRSESEVQTALVDMLAIEEDFARRLRVAGAAYATYPNLWTYFEAEVKHIAVLPDSATRDELLAFVADVRANVESKHGRGT
ncbi:hypothetical protein [Haliangium sp.]|uniref:hypothetical protein n=1 Tax=Haliangium sp. TaxID=2663208 RepID=UPI003D097DAE